MDLFLKDLKACLPTSEIVIRHGIAPPDTFCELYGFKILFSPHKFPLWVFEPNSITKVTGMLLFNPVNIMLVK